MADLRPILLVEDNPKDIELTLAALAKCQLANSIVLTRDGAEALDCLEASRPDAVLLDMVMPRATVDGFAFISRLRLAKPEVRARLLANMLSTPPATLASGAGLGDNLLRAMIDKGMAPHDAAFEDFLDRPRR